MKTWRKLIQKELNSQNETWVSSVSRLPDAVPTKRWTMPQKVSIICGKEAKHVGGW